MLGCVLSQLKPSELYMLSCGRSLAFGLGLFHSKECRAPRALSYTEFKTFLWHLCIRYDYKY